jgi:hypothetical protein
MIPLTILEIKRLLAALTIRPYRLVRHPLARMDAATRPKAASSPRTSMFVGLRGKCRIKMVQ